MKIYYHYIDFNKDYPTYDFLLEDRNNINRITNKEARYRKIAGYRLFYDILGSYREYLMVSKYGKPYLNKKNIYFNISHSFNIAAIAVSTMNLGLDIEKIRPYDTRLVDKVICENGRIQLLKNPDDNSLFYKYWTAKESIIKYDGKGLRIDLQSIDVKKILDFQEKNIEDFNKEVTCIPMLQHFNIGEYIGCVYSKDRKMELIEIL